MIKHVLHYNAIINLPMLWHQSPWFPVLAAVRGKVKGTLGFGLVKSWEKDGENWTYGGENVVLPSTNWDLMGFNMISL